MPCHTQCWKTRTVSHTLFTLVFLRKGKSKIIKQPIYWCKDLNNTVAGAESNEKLNASESGTEIFFTWYSLWRHSMVSIEVNPSLSRLSHVFWTCSMQGEKEQIRPPGITQRFLNYTADRGYSSVVEHSTADREVPGSNPGAPSLFSNNFEVFTEKCRQSSVLFKLTSRLLF